MIFQAEHHALMQSLTTLIDREINPYVDEWEEEKRFPAHQVFQLLGQAGMLGLSYEETYGGSGLDLSYNIAMAEALGHIHCAGIPMAIGVQTDMATPALARFGSDELKRQFLMPSIHGDFVACLGVSEPHAGSDVARVKTQARLKGDDYVINGTKMWITNSTQADWMCLLANTSDKALHQNKSLFCVPMNLPGITVSTPFNKLGMWSSDTAQVFFDNVIIPKRFLIGEEGKGFIYQMLQFQQERLWSAANSLAQMERIIQATIDYTRDRVVFGQPLLDRQSIHFKLAECQTEIEALRALVYRATGLFLQGNDVTPLASMAKLKAGRLIREVSDSCLQFWGGMGYMTESVVCRSYRDARLLSIGAGADEVMLTIICKTMNILPESAQQMTRQEVARQNEETVDA